MTELVDIAPLRAQSGLQVRLLGGVEATDIDRPGSPLDLGPEKCRAVFAGLALSVGEAVPVSRLIELVWGEMPPRTADKTLQSYVTRLRKVLGSETIERAGAAYRLRLAPTSVDVVRFQQFLDKDDVTGALREWLGPPLVGLGPGGFTAVVDGLTEKWLGALEVDLADQLDRDAGSVIGRLTELTGDHPFREGLWALLMTALYRSGRQADALAAYGRARRQLVEELGVEPGPRLRALETSILAQDETLAPTRAVSSTAAPPPVGTVTVVFADIVGISGLWASHRQQLAEMLNRIGRLLLSSAADNHGHVFNAGGESYGLAFHRPSEAVRWAATFQDLMAQESESDQAGLLIRIGINTGETEDRGPGYFGPAVNVAAGLAASGHGGQTLISATTAALLDTRTELRDLGTYRLDGVIADQRILQLGTADHPPLRTEEARRGNLPRRQGRLLGRDRDLQNVADTMGQAPVVTLVGPGGIGKTRLGLAAARVNKDRFPDGTWLVELAGINASADVPRALADVMEVQENPSLGLTESIVTSLRSRRCLIILDNCEHVIDGAAELAAALVERCQDVQILATSREGLGVSDERLMAVSPLDPEGAAVELFIDRACAVSPAFDPSSDRQLIVEICRRLDGVPLAIELAAARIQTLAPADLVDRLDNRLRLLSGGRRTSVERHRTLRATVQWSYDLLAPADQVLFKRLSVFAGPFDLNAAQQVAVGGAGRDHQEPDPEPLLGDLRLDIGELLGALVDRSMLIVESGTFGRRFRLLETMRQFGAERLSEAGDTDLIAERHAYWCLEQVGEIHRSMAGNDEVEAVARLTELWPNLRAGFDWACTVGDRRLAYGLVRPVAPEILLRAQSEIGDWLERLLIMALDGGPSDSESESESESENEDELVAFCLLWVAHRYTITQNHDGFQTLLERCGQPDHPWIHYGRAFLNEDADGLAQWWEQAAALADAYGERYTAGLIELGGQGQSLLSQGRFEELDAMAAELAERYRAAGPPTLLHFCLAMWAYSAMVQQRHDDAEALFAEAAEVDTPERTLGLDTSIQARAALRRGERERAVALLAEHVDRLLATDNMYQTRMACVDFINTMTIMGCHREAAPLIGYLDRPDLLDIEISRSLISDEARANANHPELERTGLDFDARGALEHIQKALAELTSQSNNGSRS